MVSIPIQMIRLLFAIFLMSASVEAADVQPHADWDFSELGKTPVLSGGRIKPFDSYARELVLHMVEKRTLPGWNPVDLVLSWMTNKTDWHANPFLKIRTEQVKRQLLMDEKEQDFSPAQLMSSTVFAQYLQEYASQSQATAKGSTLKFDPREQELNKVLDRVLLYFNLLTGRALPLLPRAQPAPWDTLDKMREPSFQHPVVQPIAALLRAYMDGNREEFQKKSVEVRNAVESSITSYDDHTQKILSLEFYYNQYRPFLVAWIFYLLGAIGFACMLVAKQPKWIGIWKSVAWSTTLFGFVVNGAGLAARVIIAGRPPVSNMYESVVWVAFGTLIFAFILYWRLKQPVILAAATTVACLILIASDSAPAVMDPNIHPLVPVLRSNYWLTIHVLTITLSYASFALTLGLANITLWHFAFKKAGYLKKVENLNQLTYRAMQFGVVLVAAGTILGGVWADESWGRFWGWDPKEVWALIVLLAYIAVLHGRLTGWVKSYGFAALSVICFTTVLMAWYGVNFILGVGLHSYGFSAGGTMAVTTYVALQLAYVAATRIMFMRKVA